MIAKSEQVTSEMVKQNYGSRKVVTRITVCSRQTALASPIRSHVFVT